MRRTALFSALLVLASSAALTLAEEIDKKVQERIDAKVKEIQQWAAEKVVVEATKQQNAAPPAAVNAMTEEKWKGLTLTDEFVKSLSKNAVAELLSKKKDAYVTEAFLSDASGRKVAFLAKTTSWCHAGKAKHENPMKNKMWQGPVEVDESTGILSVQVAVPVLDGDKPIGSLVVGLNYTKMKKDA